MNANQAEVQNPLSAGVGSDQEVTTPVEPSAAASAAVLEAQLNDVLSSMEYRFDRFDAALFKSAPSSDLSGFVAIGTPMTSSPVVDETAPAESPSDETATTDATDPSQEAQAQEAQPTETSMMRSPVPQSVHVAAQLKTTKSTTAKILLVVAAPSGVQVHQLVPLSDGTLGGLVTTTSNWESIRIVAATDELSVGTGEVLMLLTGAGL